MELLTCLSELCENGTVLLRRMRQLPQVTNAETVVVCHLAFGPSKNESGGELSVSAEEV